jgi:hypothetical protein
MKKCLECDHRPARRLLDARPGDTWFCSLRCAARYALHDAMNRMRHCDKHGRWHHQDDGCDDCEGEDRELMEEADEA